MISLFVDTCTSNLILAVCVDRQVIKKIVQRNDTNLSTNFTSFVDNLIKDCNLSVNDINKIFVSVGPGSFTGIRVGLTFAKVFAWSLKIPIIPVSSLEVMASSSDDDILVSMIDARRRYVYAGIYDSNLNNILEDKYILLEDLQKRLAQYNSITYISCDDFDFDVMSPDYKIEKIVNKHYNDSGVNPHSLVPRYLKKTEAEEKLGVN